MIDPRDSLVYIIPVHCFRKVIYELELQRSDEDRQEARCPFTVIEIPFGSIVGLNGSGTTVLLELNMMAYMFLGFRSCDSDGNFVPRKIASYNRNMHVDLTGQQLEIMPYHQVQYNISLSSSGHVLLTSNLF